MVADAVHFVAAIRMHKFREGGYHTNRDTHAHREG